MQGHKLLAFVQAIKSNRSTQSMQTLHNENAAMKNHKLASVQSCEPLAKSSLIRRGSVRFSRFWQSLVKFAETTQETKVTWMRDRQGHSYFKIYDPLTEQHHYADSEQEVQIWLEQRYQHTKRTEKPADNLFRSFDCFERILR
jgi:hypothetical protein